MMAERLDDPEIKEARERWIDVLLSFEFEEAPSVVLIGARWAGDFAYLGRTGVYPGSRVLWRLPETIFERGVLVELALRVGGGQGLDFRAWERMDWSWTGVFKATTRSGQAYLEPT